MHIRLVKQACTDNDRITLSIPPARVDLCHVLPERGELHLWLHLDQNGPVKPKDKVRDVPVQVEWFVFPRPPERVEEAGPVSLKTRAETLPAVLGTNGTARGLHGSTRPIARDPTRQRSREMRPACAEPHGAPA